MGSFIPDLGLTGLLPLALLFLQRLIFQLVVGQLMALAFCGRVPLIECSLVGSLSLLDLNLFFLLLVLEQDWWLWLVVCRLRFTLVRLTGLVVTCLT